MDRTELDHLRLFDVPFFFGASKSREYRDRILMRAQATAEVLTEHALSKSNLIERFYDQPEAFRVTYGELTDLGVEFVRSHYHRWLSNSDRWQAPFTYDKFKRALELQWGKFSANGS